MNERMNDLFLIIKIIPIPRTPYQLTEWVCRALSSFKNIWDVVWLLVESIYLHIYK